MGFDPLNKIFELYKNATLKNSAFALAAELHTLGLRTWGNFCKRLSREENNNSQFDYSPFLSRLSLFLT